MKIYLIDEKVRTVNTDDIVNVIITKNPKNKNDFTISVTDDTGKHKWYSMMFPAIIKYNECINRIKNELFVSFEIPEDKIKTD